MKSSKPEVLNGIPIPYNASMANLRDMVAISSPEAWSAIRALAHRPEPQALALLVELSHSSDWRFRRSAVEAIGIHQFGQSASEVVSHLLCDPVAFVIRSAVEAAENLGLKVTHDPILRLVDAPEANTRITALHALESLWQPNDFEKVIEHYLNDPSETVRKQAA